MTFGEIKTIIEESMIDSYKDSKNFKSIMNQFQQNVLSNKSVSKLYFLYDDLSSEKNLSESEAKDYLQEGLELIKTVLEESKLPRFTFKKSDNKYQDIDTLVYSKNVDISSRLDARKRIVETLMKRPNLVKENINLPLNSMVSVANQTISKFVENMDESSKKDFLYVIKEDQKKLKVQFENIKESTIEKLKTHLQNQNEDELKIKINETINKLKKEEFNQMNFVRLKSLETSL